MAISEEFYMKKQYIKLRVKILVFSHDIVASSKGDEYEDDIWQ